MYFVNIYVRVDPLNKVFYDCNFGFYPDDTAQSPAPTEWKTFRFDLNTKLEIARNGANPIDSVNVCSTYNGKTLQDFINAHPNTVIGVGNGDTETINLVVGETSGNYKGLEVCWDNAQVTTTTDRFVYDFEPAA